MTAFPRIFEIITATPAVTALLGVSPTRFYPSRSPKNAPKPYAVYNVFNAIPQNYLAGPADIDQKGTQIDIYAATAQSCSDVMEAIRAALEPDDNKIRVISFSILEQDAETDAYHARLEVDVWETR